MNLEHLSMELILDSLSQMLLNLGSIITRRATSILEFIQGY